MGNECKRILICENSNKEDVSEIQRETKTTEVVKPVETNTIESNTNKAIKANENFTDSEKKEKNGAINEEFVGMNYQLQENIVAPDGNLLPEDDFSKYIFTQINKLRQDPQSFIQNITDNEHKVITGKHGRLIFKSNVKVALTKGIEAFEEAKEILQETAPMEPLIYNPRMNIPLPKNEEDIQDKQYLKNQSKDMIQAGVPIKAYWRDIVKDPQTSFLLMVVDDGGVKAGMKRKYLLDPKMRYIGINSTVLGNSFVCYMTFSDRD